MNFPKTLSIICAITVLISSCQSQSAVAASPTEVPTSTAVPTVIAPINLTPIPAQVPLMISPDGCASSNGQLPTLSNLETSSTSPVNNTLGGGSVQSKEFTIELFLYCDTGFQPKAPETYHQSDIGGLAIYHNWRYDAPHESGLIHGFFGIEPDILWQTGEGPSTSQGYIAQGQSTGVRLPPNSIYDFSKPTSLRFIYILQTQSGQLSGAALSFSIQQTSVGFQPGNILITALSDPELKSMELIKTLVPTSTP